MFAELQLRLYKSNDENMLFILFGASEERLRRHADFLEFNLEMDGDAIYNTALQILPCLPGNERIPIVDLIRDEHEDFSRSMLDGLYADFQNFNEDRRQGDWKLHIFKNHNRKGQMNTEYRQDTIFSENQRLKLTKSIVATDNEWGGAHLKLIVDPNDHVLAYFPLHNYVMQEELFLKSNHLTVLLHPPIEEIRKYFGEEVALYFYFLSIYSRWLRSLSIAGFFVFIWQVSVRSANVPGIFPFSFMIMAWSTLFLEHWKREEARLSTNWGTGKTFKTESVRPEFEGKDIPSKVTGKREKVFPRAEKNKRTIISYSIVVFFIMLFIGFSFIFFFCRKYLVHTSIVVMTLPVLAYALMILLVNNWISTVARKLTDYENHRTETEYENSLIKKVFLLKFFNSFYSLLHIILFKRYDTSGGYCIGSYLHYTFALTKHDTPWYDRMQLHTKDPIKMPPKIVTWVDEMNLADIPCSEWPGIHEYTLAVCSSWDILQKKGWDYRGNCLNELSLNFSIIFLVQLIIGNLIEVVAEQSHMLCKKSNENNNDEQSVRLLGLDDTSHSTAEKQFFRPRYEGSFDDYDEIIVQFSFVLIFVVAFPLAPLIALLFNFWEFRSDLGKVMRDTQRMFPYGVQSIGAWSDILQIITYLGLAINVAILTLIPSDILPEGKVTLVRRIVIFLILEHSFIAVKISLGYIIPDIPEKVSEQLIRQEHISTMFFCRQ